MTKPNSLKALAGFGFLAFSLSGCIVSTAVGVAGEVVEGAANVTVGTVKTAGKVAGAVIPDGDQDDDTSTSNDE